MHLGAQEGSAREASAGTVGAEAKPVHGPISASRLATFLAECMVTPCGFFERVSKGGSRAQGLYR